MLQIWMVQIWMLWALVMPLCLLMSLRNELRNPAPEQMGRQLWQTNQLLICVSLLLAVIEFFGSNLQTATVLLALAAYWQFMQSYAVDLILQPSFSAKAQSNFSSQSGAVSSPYRLANERLCTTIEKMTLLGLIAAGFMQSLLFAADTSLLITATLLLLLPEEITQLILFVILPLFLAVDGNWLPLSLILSPLLWGLNKLLLETLIQSAIKLKSRC
jgi:hypothetical protein